VRPAAVLADILMRAIPALEPTPLETLASGPGNRVSGKSTTIIAECMFEARARWTSD
jgi:hypothetical protein